MKCCLISLLRFMERQQVRQSFTIFSAVLRSGRLVALEKVEEKPGVPRVLRQNRHFKSIWTERMKRQHFTGPLLMEKNRKPLGKRCDSAQPEVKLIGSQTYCNVADFVENWRLFPSAL